MHFNHGRASIEVSLELLNQAESVPKVYGWDFTTTGLHHGHATTSLEPDSFEGCISCLRLPMYMLSRRKHSDNWKISFYTMDDQYGSCHQSDLEVIAKWVKCPLNLSVLKNFDGLSKLMAILHHLDLEPRLMYYIILNKPNNWDPYQLFIMGDALNWKALQDAVLLFYSMQREMLINDESEFKEICNYNPAWAMDYMVSHAVGKTLADLRESEDSSSDESESLENSLNDELGSPDRSFISAKRPRADPIE